MTIEKVMGLNVVNDEEYQRYREGMEPILKSFGGTFGFDFKIAEVLRSKTDDEINRLFTISFPSKSVMEEFFSHSDYLSVKERHFRNSVKSLTSIAMYEKSDF